ncbi:glycoside hydrolase family 15 protein [Telluribacter sp.]|jgi:GH15 family glucan-1,4-alpha-glucosidase|uniref:glycoside hydrolase family 15 protein n=1 Tax=Telluribacter sp. TaxID=1978767 RepID=UPI002E0EEE21|nr:glycoside hydrolase family 15 protein [Telluribacter sp.]
MSKKETDIRDLAMIGDRRTCALLDKRGNLVWYCPRRFDEPSLFASILDNEKGGAWNLELPGLESSSRMYVAESAVLQTRLKAGSSEVLLQDWMPLQGSFYGICRTVSASPVPYTVRVNPRPNYNRRPVVLAAIAEGHASLEFDFHFYASHPVEVGQESITCRVPEGETAWFVLAERALQNPQEQLEQSMELTLKNWQAIASHITYNGPYEEEVRKSLRQLRLLTYVQNGGIIAAATTSLPEVPGGGRNYDYRYVWLRDAAMIVSALARVGSDGEEERRFLSFMCSAMHRIPKPVVPMLTLDEQPAGTEQLINFRGYLDSTPVRYGNGANEQLQLDANSNVIIAAKVIYNLYDTREHWETIRELANFLVDTWDNPDHGIWEETPKHHYTSSKVVASISLKYISEHSQDQEEKKRWQEASEQIRQFVEEKCITSDGAYAVYAGSQDIDVSAALFPIWGFIEADTPEMVKTMEKLEQDYCQNHLYRRHLVEYDSRREGAFLAGTFWVAQYWVMRRNRERFEQIVGAALRFMNDVGVMPEEGDPITGDWLGNIPQAFVHASLIGAVIDYKDVFG